MTNSTPLSRRLAPLAPALLPLLCLTWVYWSTFGDLLYTWRGSDQYSHGFLVPIFAAFLLWQRREKLDAALMQPSLWGLALLAVGIGMKLGGAYGYYVSLDPYSLVPCVAGLVILVGGWHTWRWAWPAVCFLVFMLPLPYFASVAMSSQLQSVATISSTFVMQTLGLPALSEGNVIHLNEQPINIVEACSGLRMLVVFVALSAAVVLVANRHWIDGTIILVSSFPIAIVTNVIRITATGIMFDLGYSEMANHFFHDFAGWVMPLIALSMLWGEVKLLDVLFTDAPKTAVPLPSAARRAVPRPAVPRRVRGTKPPKADNALVSQADNALASDAPTKRAPTATPNRR